MTPRLTAENVRAWEKWLTIERKMLREKQTPEEEQWWSDNQERIMKIHGQILALIKEGRCCDE